MTQEDYDRRSNQRVSDVVNRIALSIIGVCVAGSIGMGGWALKNVIDNGKRISVLEVSTVRFDEMKELNNKISGNSIMLASLAKDVEGIYSNLKDLNNVLRRTAPYERK